MRSIDNPVKEEPVSLGAICWSTQNGAFSSFIRLESKPFTNTCTIYLEIIVHISSLETWFTSGDQNRARCKWGRGAELPTAMTKEQGTKMVRLVLTKTVCLVFAKTVCCLVFTEWVISGYVNGMFSFHWVSDMQLKKCLVFNTQLCNQVGRRNGTKLMIILINLPAKLMYLLHQ